MAGWDFCHPVFFAQVDHGRRVIILPAEEQLAENWNHGGRRRRCWPHYRLPFAHDYQRFLPCGIPIPAGPPPAVCQCGIPISWCRFCPCAPGRQFEAIFWRREGQSLGIQVEDHFNITILQVYSLKHRRGAVEEYNERCDTAYPEKKIEVGNCITKVNGVEDKVGMMGILSSSGERGLFIVFRKECVWL